MTLTTQLSAGRFALTPVTLVPVTGTGITGTLRPDVTGIPLYVEKNGGFLNVAASRKLRRMANGVMQAQPDHRASLSA
jgi:hypothetical protein